MATPPAAEWPPSLAAVMAEPTWPRLAHNPAAPALYDLAGLLPAPAFHADAAAAGAVTPPAARPAARLPETHAALAAVDATFTDCILVPPQALYRRRFAFACMVPAPSTAAREAAAATAAAPPTLVQPLRAVNHNPHLTGPLTALADAYEADEADEHDGFRARSLRKTIAFLEHLPVRLDSWSALRHLLRSMPEAAARTHGIGESIREKLKQLLELGRLPQLETKAADERHRARCEMQKVFGIGPRKAAWLVNPPNNLRTLAQLQRACGIAVPPPSSAAGPVASPPATPGLAPTVHPPVGPSGQLLLLEDSLAALRHINDLQLRIPRAEVAAIVAFVADCAREVYGHDVEVACCGSYRRGKASSGDVDILISPPWTGDIVADSKHLLLEPLVTRLHAAGAIVHRLREGGCMDFDADRHRAQRVKRRKVEGMVGTAGSVAASAERVQRSAARGIVMEDSDDEREHERRRDHGGAGAAAAAGSPPTAADSAESHLIGSPSLLPPSLPTVIRENYTQTLSMANMVQDHNLRRPGARSHAAASTGPASAALAAGPGRYVAGGPAVAGRKRGRDGDSGGGRDWHHGRGGASLPAWRRRRGGAAAAAIWADSDSDSDRDGGGGRGGSGAKSEGSRYMSWQDVQRLLRRDLARTTRQLDAASAPSSRASSRAASCTSTQSGALVAPVAVGGRVADSEATAVGGSLHDATTGRIDYKRVPWLPQMRYPQDGVMLLGRLPGVDSTTGAPYRVRRIDIKSYPRVVLPFAMLYFTGSDYFNRSLRHYVNNCGWRLTDQGLRPVVRDGLWGPVEAEGLSVRVRSEHDIFVACGCPYRTPEERDCVGGMAVAAAVPGAPSGRPIGAVLATGEAGGDPDVSSGGGGGGDSSDDEEGDALELLIAGGGMLRDGGEAEAGSDGEADGGAA